MLPSLGSILGAADCDLHLDSQYWRAVDHCGNQDGNESFISSSLKSNEDIYAEL